MEKLFSFFSVTPSGPLGHGGYLVEKFRQLSIFKGPRGVQWDLWGPTEAFRGHKIRDEFTASAYVSGAE